MSTHVFVKASVCWADEFDCEICGAWSKEDWKDLVSTTKKAFDNRGKVKLDEYGRGGEIEIGFGTNESLTVSNYNEWFSAFTVKDISKDEFNILRKCLAPSYAKGSFTFGTGDGYFHIVERIED